MRLDWFLALSPIVMILLVMMVLRWSAARAGSLGWLVAIAVAILRFGAGADLLAVAQSKAFFLSLDVLLIIWSAFLLYRVCDESGAIAIIGQALPRLTADRGMQALLLGWGFASFLQGVGGFGVPVAVIAPLLIGLGFTPLSAVVIPSIGHAWAVTFGSLASSFQALIAASGVPGEELAAPSALLLGLASVAVGFMVAHASQGWSALRRLAIPVLLLGLAMGAGQYLLATAGLWNIAGLGGGMVGVALGAGLASLPRLRSGRETGSALEAGRLWIASSGYIALVLITLAVHLTPGVRSVLDHFVLRLSFPEVSTSLGYLTPAGFGRQIHYLSHAGTILSLSAGLAYLFFRRAGMVPAGSIGPIISSTVRKVLPSSLGIVTMVSMATVMTHSGMTDTLAAGLAEAAGRFFPLSSAWIGALGAFMTGSNTNSNVVFAALQGRTAELLGYSVPFILASQTAGGAIGSVIAPTKIVVGASTASMMGEEGLVLRALLPYIVLLLVGISLVTLLVLGA